MTVVVEVGPGAVRGPDDGMPEMVSLALECIDDDLALLDDRVVAVADLWRDVMSAAAGGSADVIAVVCPAWWSPSRIDRVRAAALTVAPDVQVLDRARLLRDSADRPVTVVEIAPEFVVVSHLSAGATAVPRRGDVVADAEAVVAALGEPAAVLVDAAVGVVGADALGATIADRLRTANVAVTFAGKDSVRCAATAGRLAESEPPVRGSGRQRGVGARRGTAVLAGMGAAAMLCGGFAIRGATPDAPAGAIPMTLFVEGRIGVMVPSAWRAERITSGPGSSRVQVVSPSDADLVLHLTQSANVGGSTLAMAADSLSAAMDAEPEGVFVDFNPAGSRAGRQAVTYREIRPEHHVAWVVLIDGEVRIAIGCQSAPGREDLVRDVCDRAVASAHAIR